MSEKPDHYTLLGVLRTATPEEIKRAYYDAAQRLHPDKNKAPGETEFFLDIQQAYEVLSNAKQRSKYDAALPPESDEPSGPVQLKVSLSRQSLVKTDEPQLIYALLEVMPTEENKATPAPPLNVCMIIDRSTSMQGPKMDMVKATTIQVMRRLRPQDTFGVVLFSDRAEVLIPCDYQGDRAKLEAQVQMVQHSGATEILQGLEAGFHEVLRHVDPDRVNHIILLTDGHTYGDEDACLALADLAAKQGIGISGLGIGKDWNDSFLDGLANHTGGSSAYVSRPDDIQRLLIEKFSTLARVFAEDVILDFKVEPGVSLNYTFRLEPDASSLAAESPLFLGPILQDINLTLLIEFLVQPVATKGKKVTLLDGALKTQIPSFHQPVPPIHLKIQSPVSDSANPEPPPTAILRAMSRLSLYRMQEKAHAAVQAGEFAKASRQLQNLASHLLSQGERGLARTALLEAENILRTQAFSEEGKKEIKYGTRALCLPAKTQE